ncbi:MAG TPA: hypothetical protein VFE62_24310 [Gemmataceae bacterium]|nr:hypothetical protein [Gemmataceae bacterium]
MIRFNCACCGKRLKTLLEHAGRHVICARCGSSQTVPLSSTYWRASVQTLALCLAPALLVLVAILAAWSWPKSDPFEDALRALRTNDPAQSQPALQWLTESDPVDAERPKVTAALEGLLLNGDVHHNLDPNLVLSVYLAWADKDNVPALARMVQNPTAPGWDPRKTALAMDALAKLGDDRGYAALAAKLGDPALHDQAINALRIVGPKSQAAVLPYAFDGNPDTRGRALSLLSEFGTSPRTVADAASARLRSPQIDVRRSALTWFLENAPSNDSQKSESAALLGKMLADPSPDINSQALRALKAWATRDCLPDLVEYARCDQLTPGGNPDLIEVLARFNDASAADAVALQLKNNNTRAVATQALLKLGPVAENAVLANINHPDRDAQKQARSVARMLKISDDRLLDQTLADVADSRIARSRTALHRLAEIRPDAANRAKVSAALNATLIDPSRGLSDESLNALRVWGTAANTDTLVKMLVPAGSNARVIEFLGAIQDPRAAAALAPSLEHASERPLVSRALRSIGSASEDAVAPYLDSLNGAVRCEATRILGDIGTTKSLHAMERAYRGAGGNLEFSRELEAAMQRIAARS